MNRPTPNEPPIPAPGVYTNPAGETRRLVETRSNAKTHNHRYTELHWIGWDGRLLMSSITEWNRWANKKA